MLFYNSFLSCSRVLKVLGCQHGCHNSIRPGQHSMAANTTPSGGDISALRARGVAILSRLLWYDKKQFKSYLTMFVETKSITFLLNFVHGYLSFCCDSSSPFSNVNVIQGVVAFGESTQSANINPHQPNSSTKHGVAFDFSNQSASSGRSRASVVSSHELNRSYETNFANSGASDYHRHASKQMISGDCQNSVSTNATQLSTNLSDINTASGAPGTPRAVENIIVSTMYRRLVSKLVEKLPWLKLPENDSHYLDVRGLMHYVKQWHGGTFRRVVLSGLLDSTRMLVKTQYRVDLGYTSHIPAEGGQRG